MAGADGVVAESRHPVSPCYCIRESRGIMSRRQDCVKAGEVEIGNVIGGSEKARNNIPGF